MTPLLGGRMDRPCCERASQMGKISVATFEEQQLPWRGQRWGQEADVTVEPGWLCGAAEARHGGGRAERSVGPWCSGRDTISTISVFVSTLGPYERELAFSYDSLGNFYHM